MIVINVRTVGETALIFGIRSGGKNVSVISVTEMLSLRTIFVISRFRKREIPRYKFT